MFSGLVDESMMTPKTNIIYLWRHQDAQNNSRKSNIIFEKNMFGKFQQFGNRKFWKFWKRRGLTNPEDLSDKFLKILDMGPISSRKDEMDILDFFGKGRGPTNPEDPSNMF